MHTKQVILLLSLFLLNMNLFAQRDFSKVEITVEQVTENIHVLFGSGGNIGILSGADGVIMIDDQYAPLSEKIEVAIQTISDHPVKYLLNTHWHGDHTGGNANFANKGATIIAHENVRERLSKDHIKAFNRTVKAAPEAAWPVLTFSDKMSLHANGEDIIAIHVHNAHTDGDALMYFPNSNVIHMGDTYFNGRFPYIDLSSGGSVNGLIEAANKALFLIDEETKVIPGHGALSNKKELTAYRDMIVKVSTKVKEAVAAGKTVEEIKAANFTEGFEEWGNAFISSDRFLDILYTDFSR